MHNAINSFAGKNIVNGLDYGNLEPSEYIYVTIDIKTAYEWGNGWRTICDKVNFEKEVFTLLQKNNFEIVESNIVGAASSLISENKKTSIYLHPMKFSGFAKKDEIEKIVEILKNCTTIEEIINVETQNSYDITEKEYTRILSMNIQKIEDFILEKAKTMKVYDIPGLFTKKYSILQTGKTPIISSDDVAWRYADAIIDVLIAKGKISKHPEWY